MEHVWVKEFSGLFSMYYPHCWYLQPVEARPTGGNKLHTFVDSAKVRFSCEECGHGWTSMKGRVAFWVDLFYVYGIVAFKLYGQKCDRCKTQRYEQPMWYPEEVNKVLVNVYNKVGQLYYGFYSPPIEKMRRAGKPRTPHNADLCQACKDGLCTDLTVIISYSRPAHSQCGHRPVVDRLVGRVVGGQDAFYGQVPWQALVKESQLFGLLQFRKCGAVLISDRWALTAAHCSAGWLGSLVVILGEHDLNKFAEQEKVEERQVKRIVIHPDFDKTLFSNDIALVELTNPVRFNSNLQPICLPSRGEDFSGQVGYVSGWGYTQYKAGKLPSILQVVKLPIMTNGQCRAMYKKAGFNRTTPKGIICAGLAAGGKDSCSGDSGGPLMAYSKSRRTWLLVGIVSNGIKCGEPNLPGIYTRVSEYLNWIDNVTSGRL
ncbi:Serine proteinase stubble [Halotydeus destructor]|nr:Serine proteinase stubble [Halotydeus destructor]